MGKLKPVLLKSIFLTTAIFAGICLFILLSSYNINRTFLNEEFHEELFKKNDIYGHTYKVIDRSIDDLISSIKQYYPKDFDQYKQVFSIIKSTVTPELVKYNLDSVRNELFQYFRGEKRFLPDIYLELPSTPKQGSIQVNSLDKKASQSAISVDRINLSAILLYTNRTDISDKLFVVKFIYYLLDSVPGIMLMIMLIFMVLGIYLCRSRKDLKLWLQILFLSCGLPLAFTGAALLIYTFNGMPKAIYPLVLSLPIPREVIVSYIQGSIVPASVWILASGLLFIGFMFLLRFVPAERNPEKPVPQKKPAKEPVFDIDSAIEMELAGITPEEKEPADDNISAGTKVGIIVKNIVFGLAGLLLISLIGFKAFAMKTDYDRNDFALAVSKMKGTDTTMEVIAAQDEAIYTLQVKVVGKEDGQPKANIPVNIVGKREDQDKQDNDNPENPEGQENVENPKSTDDLKNPKNTDNLENPENQEDEINLTAYTDETGTARFTLEKGTYRVGFLPSEFPKEFTMPAPYFFEMKTPGTTMITINLEPPTADELEKWGIVEIEVLDSSNNPVPDLELEVTGNVSAPGDPESIYSITNSEGIAVFRLHQGDHSIGFVAGKFPTGYELPPSIDVTVVPNAAVRYGIRLVDANLD